jgi:hypothetical protein
MIRYRLIMAIEVLAFLVLLSILCCLTVATNPPRKWQSDGLFAGAPSLEVRV